MTNTYLPGQLYKGRDGDLLFAVLPGDEFEFVTNRGTRLTLAHVEEVYAPLTLLRPVQGEAPEPVTPTVRKLAEAIRDAVTVPVVDSVKGRDFDELTLRSTRMAHVFGAMNAVATGGSAVSAATSAILAGVERTPVTYPTHAERVERSKDLVDQYAVAVAEALDGAGVAAGPPATGERIGLDLTDADSALVWDHTSGWRVYRRVKGERVDERFLRADLVPSPPQVVREVQVWLAKADALPTVAPDRPRVDPLGELDGLLKRAVAAGEVAAFEDVDGGGRRG